MDKNKLKEIDNGINNLIETTEKEKDIFWCKLYNEELSNYDLLEAAVRIIHLQDGVISNLMFKNKLIEN